MLVHVLGQSYLGLHTLYIHVSHFFIIMNRSSVTSEGKLSHKLACPFSCLAGGLRGLQDVSCTRRRSLLLG